MKKYQRDEHESVWVNPNHDTWCMNLILRVLLLRTPYHTLWTLVHDVWFNEKQKTNQIKCGQFTGSLRCKNLCKTSSRRIGNEFGPVACLRTSLKLWILILKMFFDVPLPAFTQTWPMRLRESLNQRGPKQRGPKKLQGKVEFLGLLKHKMKRSFIL